MTARRENTRNAIKEAFLLLLQEKRSDDVAMSELATHADVSRSTLYSHFANIHEVFEECVVDFSCGLRSLNVHLKCSDCASDADRTRPFCVALRDAGKYEALVREPSFLMMVLETALPDVDHGCLADANLSYHQQRALFRFQMSGCYAVAMDPAFEDWDSIQHTLDAYIRGGMHAARRL